MKRFLTIIVALAYFVASSGFVVNLHYCMDRFHSWEVGGGQKEKCATCGMSAKQNKCCHDDVKVVKVPHEVTAAKYFAFAVDAPAAVPQIYSLFLVPELQALELPAAPTHGPPLISKRETYLRNCVFRI